MFSLTPSGSPADASAVFALLALIADPKASAQRLEELNAEKQSAIDAMKDAQAATIDLEKERAAAGADRAEAEKIRDDFNAKFETRTKQIADAAADLDARQDKISAQEREIAERENAVADAEAAVKAREDQVFAREQAEKQLTEAAKALKSEYEQKVAALRAAVQ